MAHLLNCERLSLALADRTLLDEVSVGVDDGDRVGIVGRNGDGKSTLLRIITGGQEPDSGRVSLTGGLRIGYLTQTDSMDDTASVRQAVVGDREEYEWASNPRIRDVLTGLLHDIEASVPGGFDAPVANLSGGQRRRVALAAVLIDDHDVLILDEPTNHLDVEGVNWLAKHLGGRWPAGKGALLLVTHDRWFLDAVCTTTWEVQNGAVNIREGGYAAYILARAERDRMEAVTAQKRANQVKKELAWLRRGAPARTSKPKFRIDAANELIKTEPEPRDTVSLVKAATARLGKDVFDAVDVTYTTPGEHPRTLLDNVTWRIGPGDRFGIVGTNGAGKTTLIRLLLGRLTPTKGRIKRGKTVQAAVLTQDLTELEEVSERTALDAVNDVRSYIVVDGKETSAAQLMEQLGFTKQRAWTPVKNLSGGERRRLQLARLLMDEPNVLILDEPTNDLDTDTLAALEDVLDGYGGTLLVVSHDRYLLERVTDRQIGLLGDGELRDLPRGVDQYLEMRSAMLDGRAASKASAGATPASAGTGSAGSSSGLSGAELRAVQKDAARCERKVETLTAQRDTLHDQMAQAAADIDKVVALQQQLSQVETELEEVELAWMEALEALEG